MVARADKRERPKVVFIKKKNKGHAHHGGAWKVAYADFVTAMMALFMVLWLVSQTDETTRSQLARYFRSGVFSGSGHVIGESAPSGRGPTVGGGASRITSPHTLEGTVSTLEELLDLVSEGDPRLAPLRDQVDIRLDESGLLIQISDGGDEMLFGLASSELTPALEAFLDLLAPVLGRLRNELQIHGHTDSRPFPAGAAFDNWDLSFARADAARRRLEAHGVPRGQVVGVLAHADSHLLFPDAPLDPRNRRLSILAVRRGAEEPAARGLPAAEGDAEHEAAIAARGASVGESNLDADAGTGAVLEPATGPQPATEPQPAPGPQPATEPSHGSDRAPAGARPTHEGP